MWTKVASRKHTATKIFPFGTGPDVNEVMLYGNVEYVMKEGNKEVKVDWAARAHLVKDVGKVRMDFYQVYLVSDDWFYGEKMLIGCRILLHRHRGIEILMYNVPSLQAYFGTS
jgi:hypothetical protein